MAGLYGADVGQLGNLAEQLSKSSAMLEAARTALTNQLNGSTEWKGSDADRYRATWNREHRALLNQVILGLAAAGKSVRANADEQEKASADSGGFGGPKFAAGTGRPTIPQDLPPAEQIGTRRNPDPGTANLSQDEVQRLKELVDKAGDANNFWMGNDRDVTALRDALGKLRPAQLNQFLESLTDEQLRTLAGGAAQDGKGILEWQGTTPFERQALLDQLLSKASPEQVERIKALFPFAQPNAEAGGDAARAAADSRKGQAVTFKNPAGGLGSGSYQEVHQQGYGDCGTMATLAALAKSDPGFVSSHISDNGNGTVSVKLYDSDGHEQWVTVTKDLPTQDGHHYKGANGGGNMDDANAANWPGYFEKAFAQVYNDDSDGYHPGEYRAIEGDFPDKLAPYFTGTKPEVLDGADATWGAVAEGKTVVVSTSVPSPDDHGRNPGLVGAHVFFVKGTDASGNIVLGNPWGGAENDVSISRDDYKKYCTQGAVVNHK
ncbi:hypothetical protein [Arthrobacter sp. AZCC_0090]|uniref:hypothetical protein n=1 Tax=Arthrobacter sp. AZCC_0090 TaxID=2735881 RepID=UPI001618E85A|nr:hypothetical protein [Arthrobacter sp. AZCC_0090]MBB6404644.1 uncharacterized protein YukE [Arthrobacter sp. AZCC_0090]